MRKRSAPTNVPSRSRWPELRVESIALALFVFVLVLLS